MNEKIKAVGVTMKDKVKMFVKKEPDLVAASLILTGAMFIYATGVKTGRRESAALIGTLLGIYPEDNTIGQFLADINKLRG